jgi:hypothetical protein
MDAIQYTLSPLVGSKLGWGPRVEAAKLPITRPMLCNNSRVESVTSKLSDGRRPKCKSEKKKSSRRLRANASAKVEEAGAGLTYKDAGVDIDAGSELVRRIAKLTPGIGGFGGLFPSGGYPISAPLFYSHGFTMSNSPSYHSCSISCVYANLGLRVFYILKLSVLLILQ